MSNGTPAYDAVNDASHWTPTADVSWSGVTLSTDCALLYNAGKANRAVAVFTFGTQQVTNGTFTLKMPTDDGANGLVRIAR